MGRSLADFGLGHLIEPDDPEIRKTKDIADALEASIPDECIFCRDALNSAQQIVFDSIMEHVNGSIAGCFFVDGPGGTGKTFLYNALYAEVRLAHKIVLPTTTSGIAASNIPSGRTAHSRFKIPLDSEISLACDVPRQGSLTALIRATSLIIWDEASMARQENVESLDLLLRDLCDPDQVFGGKVVVFGGDFRQVLPIVPRKSQIEVVAASLVNSYLWPKMTRFRLTENIRSRHDPAYSEFLLALGNGQLQNTEVDFVQLPLHIVRCYDPEIDPIPAVASATFPEVGSMDMCPSIFTETTILTPMNEDVDSIYLV
ncbi:ATP-dependent DNA helicase PIF4-like [Chenopodium quinoa]|uniref:ATP-dependent DNA helicase PIF4-like n=1 Tax=Chenopodium quinoa TaxID=63459 RepID=UPI000B776A9D|nr:ATP-dependent DNA helicase PIF4-like [Chenopodium quinoa]